MEDESSVESKAQALLSTICNEDDPAEVFYKLFPTPEEIHDVTNADVHEDMNQRFATVLDAVLLFTTKHDQGSDDPDFAYIFISIAEAALQEPASYMKRLRNAMAYVALRHSRDGEVSSQGTEKERILAYFLWRLHGSKDEASPLPVTVSAPARDTGDSHVASHDFLPSSRTTRGPCSNCGMTQATNWCSGCSIIKSGKVVFATFYCDRSCMKAHWKTHKPACKELRALRRAAAITTELLLQELQARNRGVIVSVSEEDGLIEMKIAPADPRANLDGAPFRALPRHLVASEEQALACVSAGACGDIVEGGRVLLEVFMRPACALVEAVNVQPKNAHKTVLITYPDGKHDFAFMYFHLVLRITLPSGLRFAFDPTGLQNGWQEYLAPWDEYEQHRIHFIKDIRTIDSWVLGGAMSEMTDGHHAFLALLALVEKSLGLRLTGGGLEELLYSFPDARFETVRESLVKAFDDLLKS